MGSSGSTSHLAATAAVYQGSAGVAACVQCQNSQAVLPSAEMTVTERSCSLSMRGSPGHLMPAGIGLLVIVWLLAFLISRYVSLASIIAAAALPVITHIGARFHHLHNDKSQPTLWESGTWNKPLFFFSLVIAILAIWKHRTNINRLLKGTEHRFTRKEKSANA